MLTKRTVLVLGAGASEPFGFPTGITLSERVWEYLSPGRDAFNQLATSGYAPGDIEAFRDAFYYSGKNSVDAFLEHAPKFLSIGKAAIAVLLIPHEHQWRVFNFANNWLRVVYENLNAPFEDFRKNQIAFVTFNYDRVVEFFLHEAVMRTYEKSSDEAWRALGAIPVVHLHGRLGCLPGQGANSRPFTPEIDENAIVTSVKGIKIIHEDIDAATDEDFVRAKDLLFKAHQIIFMGFGYNQKNMERLGVANLPPDKAIGSVVNIGSQELARIKSDCQNKISFVGPGLDCMHMVSERIVWA